MKRGMEKLAFFNCYDELSELLAWQTTKEEKVAALEAAAKEGHTKCVELLLDAGAYSTKLLQIAVENSHAEVVEFLLTRVDSRVMAVKNSCGEMVKFMIPIVDQNVNFDVVFKIAVQTGCAEVVKLLLEDKRFSPVDCFITATQRGHLDVVKMLLADDRCDPSRNTSSNPMAVAATRRYIEIVRALLEDGRVVPDEHVLSAASSGGSVEIVKLLLDREGVEPYSGLITCAATSGNVEVVELLLTLVDPEHESLYCAARSGHTNVVDVLLTDGRADPCFKDNASIRKSVANKHADVIELLLRDGRADALAGLTCAPTKEIALMLMPFAGDDLANAMRAALLNGKPDIATLICVGEREENRIMWVKMYAARNNIPLARVARLKRRKLE